MRSHFGAMVAVLLGFLAYQQMSAHIEAARAAVDPEAIARFESIDWEIEGWRSRPIAIKADLKQLLGADVVVHRQYVAGSDVVEVWVNFYATNPAKGSTHSPEVCLSLQRWQWVAGKNKNAAGTGGIAISSERFTRDGKDLLAASTFLLGERSYATQPEAKLALARHGGILVFVMASVSLSSGADEARIPIVDLLERLAQRVKAAHLDSAPSTQSVFHAD